MIHNGTPIVLFICIQKIARDCFQDKIYLRKCGWRQSFVLIKSLSSNIFNLITLSSKEDEKDR